MSLGQGKSYIRVVIYKNWVILLLDRHPCLYEKKMKTNERTWEYKLNSRVIGLPKELKLLSLYLLSPTKTEYT